MTLPYKFIQPVTLTCVHIQVRRQGEGRGVLYDINNNNNIDSDDIFMRPAPLTCDDTPV